MIAAGIDRPGCEHDDLLLLRFDCGAGGSQVRFTCRTCWRKGRARPRATVAELTPVDADHEIVEHAARRWRQQELSL